MEEIKPIQGFTGYFVTTEGTIYCNLGRGNRRNNRTVPLYEVKPRLTKHGYARICARQDSTGLRKDLYVHRIVASHFIQNPEHKSYVNHKNCVRHDNRVENLEWVTAKENTNYTLSMKHVKRNHLGQYASNFTYEVKTI